MIDDRAPLLQPTVPGAVRRFWWLFLAVVLLFAGAGAAYSLTAQPVAVAQASLVVEDPRSAGPFNTGAPSASYVRDQAVILQLPVTVDLVAKDLRDEGLADLSTDDFLESLEVTTDGETNLLRLAFTHQDPEVPVPALNALIERYRDVLAFQTQRAAREQMAVLDDTLAQLDAELARLAPGDTARPDAERTRVDLVQERARLQLSEAGGDNGIRVVSPATGVEIDEGLAPPLGLALGALVGTVPGAAACYLLAQHRRRFTHRYQPESILERPLLSDVPDFSSERIRSDLPSINHPESSGAESFRFLSSALAIQQRTSRLVTVAVVSAASLDGKTTVAANLALAAARDGQRVLAIDADLTGQGLAFLLVGDERSGGGLVQVLEGSVRFDEVVKPAAYDGGSVDVLIGGAQTRFANELFASSAADELLRSFTGRYDLVLVDVPPVLQVAYTASLLSKVDAALLVVPHGASVASVEELGERIGFIDVPVAGYVYNKAPLRRELGRHSRLVSDVRRRPAASDVGVPVSRLDPVRTPEHLGQGRPQVSGA